MVTHIRDICAPDIKEVGVAVNVVNVYKDKFDVYIGRRRQGKDGYFGNPHPVGYLCKLCNTVHKRGEAVVAYKLDFNKRIQSDIEFKRRVHELKGKVLGCFCKPKDCHGDVIADYLNGLNKGESSDSPSAQLDFDEPMEDYPTEGSSGPAPGIYCEKCQTQDLEQSGKITYVKEFSLFLCESCEQIEIAKAVV